MADHLQVDYDQMAHIGQACDQQGEEAERMLRAVANQVDGLRAGGWVGQGANAFFAEMDDLVLPALNRLVAALQQAADVVRAVAYEFSEAEQETANLFSGQGAAMGQAGDHVGNFNFKVEIEGAVHGGGSLGVKIEHDNFKAADTGSQNVFFKVEDSGQGIGGNQDYKVGGNQDYKVGGSQDYKVGGNQDYKVGGSQDFKVEGSAAEQVGGAMFGGGSPASSNSPDVSKIPGPPAPFTPSPLPNIGAQADKFGPGGAQANKFDGLDDLDDAAHKV